MKNVIQTNIDELINNITTLIFRHPYLPMANISYNRNFVNILACSREASHAYGKWMHPHCLKESDGISLYYAEHDNLHYDTNEINKLKDYLKKMFNTFIKEINFKPSTIEKDLKLFHQNCRKRPSGLKKKLRSFILISPFIYNADSVSILEELNDSLLIRIMSADQQELFSLYFDMFIEHLAPIFIQLSNSKGLGEIHKLTNSIINNFIKKDVHKATSLISDDNNIYTKRAISIETIPPEYTPLRGSLAGDCSMISIPYYGLHKDTTVFWIRKTNDLSSQPVGYAFVIHIKVDNKSYPYVTTINGPTLSVSDTNHVLKAIAIYFSNDYILLPDLNQSPFLVNTNHIHDAYMNTKGNLMQITLPDGWDEIQNISHDNQNYDDYYHADYIKQVKMVRVSELDVHIIHESVIPRELRYQETDIDKLDLISRSVIGYYFIKSQISDSDNNITDILKITRKNISTVKNLISVYTYGEMTILNFNALKNEFNMGLDSLMDLNFEIRASIIRQIYDLYKDDYSPQLWSKIITKTNKEIDLELQNSDNHMYLLDTYKDLKASMPDEYIPDYWNNLLPYLFLNDSKEPDYYIINRFVKYFNSIGTIENLLQFIDSYPSLQKTIPPNSKRWIKFFNKAYDLLGKQDFCKNIITKIYVEDLLESKIRMSYREIAQTYVAYTNWYELSRENFFTTIGLDPEEKNAIAHEIDVVLESG